MEYIGMFIGSMIGSLLIVYVLSTFIERNFFEKETLESSRKKKSVIYATIITIVAFFIISASLNLGALVGGVIFYLLRTQNSNNKNPIAENNLDLPTAEKTVEFASEENKVEIKTQQSITSVENDPNTPPYYLFTIAFLIIVVVLVSFIAGEEPKEQIPSPEGPDTNMVTNPDYLRNPSKYIVDYSDVVETVLPVEKLLWVESIGEIKSPRMMSLKVSYERVVEGTNIIELTELLIPGIAGLYCNEELLRAYLQQSVVGKYLFVTAETSDYSESTWYTPHVYAQFNALSNQQELYGDLSEQMISDGFGRVPVGTSEHLYSNYSSSYNDRRKRYNPEEKITDPVSFNTNASLWRQQLVEKEQISKLKKVGGWAYCK